MIAYARPSWQLVRQLGADLFVLLWTVLWVVVAGRVRTRVSAVADPARALADTGVSLGGNFTDAGDQVSRVPGIGDELRGPFDGAARSMEQFVTQARDQVVAIEQLSVVLQVLVIAIPVSIVVAIWLPARIRFALVKVSSARFVDSGADLDLFALRAMANQPLGRLARISEDPVSDWRAGDRQVIDRLADLELRRSGLRAPKQLEQTTERSVRPGNR